MVNEYLAQRFFEAIVWWASLAAGPTAQGMATLGLGTPDGRLGVLTGPGRWFETPIRPAPAYLDE